MGVPWMVIPPKHPKMIIFSRKPMFAGYHHFRKPPYPSSNRSKIRVGHLHRGLVEVTCHGTPQPFPGILMDSAPLFGKPGLWVYVEPWFNTVTNMNRLPTDVARVWQPKRYITTEIYCISVICLICCYYHLQVKQAYIVYTVHNFLMHICYAKVGQVQKKICTT